MTMRERIFAAIMLFGLAAPVMPARAEDRLSLTVTPPFVQLGVKPGEFWASSLKVVNTNTGDLTVYATVMEFESKGEEGQGEFRPRAGTGGALADWVTVPSDPIVIPPDRSGEIPYEVAIPKDAPPGGHYAAILVGTKPFGSERPGGTSVLVSSFISTLLFVRVGGEVVEKGAIREFTTSKRVHDGPAADFTLRFENLGNVHLQPQGEVTIFNMWGKERGRVLVNQKTEFGNVLPKSVRKFSFGWTGERSFFDIGRYSAVVTLAYGREARQNVTRTIVFWVIPVKETVGAVGGTLALFILLGWGIRRYIRKALSLEMARHPGRPQARPSLGILREPLREGVVDLRAVTRPDSGRTHGARWFVRKYKIFFVGLAALVLAVVWLWVYFGQVLEKERGYDVRNTGSAPGTVSAPAP